MMISLSAGSVYVCDLNGCVLCPRLSAAWWLWHVSGQRGDVFWRGEEDKTVLGEVLTAGRAEGLINERLKLLFSGLPGSFSVHSIACLPQLYSG